MGLLRMAARTAVVAGTATAVSGRVAQILSSYLSDVFGVMGNGNVYFLDAAEKLGLRFSAVRHEGAAIAAVPVDLESPDAAGAEPFLQAALARPAEPRR